MSPYPSRLIIATAVSLLMSTAVAAPVVQPPTDPLRAFGLDGARPAISPPPEILEQLQRGNASPLREQGQALRRRLEARPGDPHVTHALATVLYHDGRRDEARRLWAGASKNEANLASAELMTGLQALFTALAARDTATAQRLLSDLEKRFAGDPHYQLAVAEQAMRSGNVTAAEKAFRQATKSGPRLWITHLNLGQFLAQVRRDPTGAAVALREAARLGPNRPEPWLHLAAFQLGQNQAYEALASMRKAVAADSSIGLPERRLAEMATEMQRPADASSLYAAALKTKPRADDELAIRVALGDALMRQNRLDEARHELEAVLKVKPIVPVVFALGTVDEAQGRLDAAERRYREVMKLQPGQPLAANNLAMLLVRQGRNAAEALSLAEQARKALPGNAIVEGTWGCALVEGGRGSEAITVLQAVVKAQPQGDPWTHYCLGKALMLAQQPKAAAEALRQALQLAPEFPRRDEIQKALASIR